MSGILSLFDSMKVKTQLAAPTGRAAKRLSEVTEREASTIHRLLEAQFDEATGLMSFFHDEDEPLKIDAMIVDETSMVDLQLMLSLLRALTPNCRLILVGDPDQLPSVGAGNVFSDLIRSGKIATVRLTEIFRQAQESLIVMNAHAVNRGELPDLIAQGQGLLLHAQADGREPRADGAGALRDAPSQEHGNRACGYSGAFSDEKGRHGHESVKSCAASRPESARDGKTGKKARRFFLPRGRPGDANSEQL